MTNITLKDDVIGKKFGKRTAVCYIKTTRIGDWYLFKCECGQEKVLSLSSLKLGRNTQCRDCHSVNLKKDRLQRKLHWLKQVDERSISSFMDTWFANDYNSKA
jgi:hypothetical protein